MLKENRAALMQLRLERAHECLESALREIEANAHKEAANLHITQYFMRCGLYWRWMELIQKNIPA